jgi:hypothetical protein
MDFSANRAMPGVLYERLNGNGIIIYGIFVLLCIVSNEVDNKK